MTSINNRFGCVIPIQLSGNFADDKLIAAQAAYSQKAPVFKVVPLKEVIPSASPDISLVLTKGSLAKFMSNGLPSILQEVQDAIKKFMSQ